MQTAQPSSQSGDIACGDACFFFFTEKFSTQVDRVCSVPTGFLGGEDRAMPVPACARQFG